MRTKLHLFLKISAFLAFGFTGFQVSASTNQCENIFLDDYSQSLSFGKKLDEVGKLGPKMQILVWNVHKGADALLPEDFERISKISDIVLLQESVSDSQFTKALGESNSQFGWTQTKSFQRTQGDFTGVATGSRIRPVSEDVLISKVVEPFSNTPKTILVSEYSMENSKDNLMVANIHAINFVTSSKFQQHIDQLVEKIKNHKGPLLIAGDFNTWNFPRMLYIEQAFSELGLKEVSTPSFGLFKLDHIYVRDINVDHVYNLSNVTSSDHLPLLVNLSFTPTGKTTKNQDSPF
jgi:endonuclease/exonuclease/phosphatase (EEP) superfamily protein YafD